jgi:hypothetical protein
VTLEHLEPALDALADDDLAAAQKRQGADGDLAAAQKRQSADDDLEVALGAERAAPVPR